jgi:oxalate decarboxylase/phosphoglucose isomerase-like protein (cupin superfamily)
MLVQTLVALLASTAALAAPLSETPAKVDKRDATSDLITQLKAANGAVARNQILAAGGNASFTFDFTNPPAAAVVSGPAGKLVQATGSTAPFLTDVDAAMAIVTIEPCGLILPHLHPRGDEFVLVIEGEVYTQFIAETGAVLIENELKTLGATLLPKGSIHLEYNPTCKPATFVAAFNTNDPGVSFVAANLFSLEDQLVIAALGGDAVVSGADLASIRHALPKGLATGVAECVKKCGIKPYSKRSLKEVYGV